MLLANLLTKASSISEDTAIALAADELSLAVDRTVRHTQSLAVVTLDTLSGLVSSDTVNRAIGLRVGLSAHAHDAVGG